MEFGKPSFKTVTIHLYSLFLLKCSSLMKYDVLRCRFLKNIRALTLQLKKQSHQERRLKISYQGSKKKTHTLTKEGEKEEKIDNNTNMKRKREEE